MRLHSAYEPVREAERYLSGILKPGNGAPMILLAGPGFGYLFEALKNIYPEAEVLLFFHSEDQRQQFLGRIIASGTDIPPCWSPSEPSTPEQVLRKEAHEWDVGRILLIEWPPAAKAVSPAIHGALLSSLKQGLEYLKSNLVTSGHFGRRWLSNCFENWLRLKDTALPVPENVPVVIAASGPTLADSAEALVRYRNRFRLWALPSSLTFLARINVVPDLVILTDPGWWAGLHNRQIPPGIPIVLALTALPPDKSIFQDHPVVCFSQNQFWERFLTAAVPSVFPVLPPHGTVAGTALHLAESLDASVIVYAGLDFAFRDIQAHARPHPFETWEIIRTTRLNPHETALCRRAWDQAPLRLNSSFRRERTGPALSAYTNWFQMKTAASSHSRSRLTRLNPSDVNWSNFTVMDSNEIAGWPVLPPATTPVKSEIPSLEERTSLLLSLTQKWRSDLATLDTSRLGSQAGRKRLFSGRPFFDILYPMETAAVIQSMKLIRDGEWDSATEEMEKARNRIYLRLDDWETRYGG